MADTAVELHVTRCQLCLQGDLIGVGEREGRWNGFISVWRVGTEELFDGGIRPVDGSTVLSALLQGLVLELEVGVGSSGSEV